MFIILQIFFATCAVLKVGEYARIAVLGHYPFLKAVTVFLKLRFRKTAPFSEQIMSSDKYPGSMFPSQMEATVYLERFSI